MLHQINAEPWNQLAPGWALAMQAALIHGIVALAVVGSFWAVFRRNMSHAFAHGLFLVVPIKAASAALFVAWPVAITFTVPLPEPVLELIHPPNMLMPQAKPAIVSQIQSVDRLEDNPHSAPEIVFNDKPQDIVPVQSITIDEPVIQQADPVAIVEAPRIKPPFSRWAVVMLAWLACVAVFTIICICNHLRMMRRLHFRHVDNLPANLSRLQQLSSRLGLRRPPLIWETSAVATPAVIGLFRPRLLIPRDFFNDFTEDEIQWALLHELAHLRRLDLWWLALERAVGLALFFHPALWVARRATRHFRELACDDTAQIQSGLSPKACAEGFLKLVIWAGRHGQSHTTHTPALSLTDRYPAIQKRIMNMTAPNATHRCARLSRESATAIAAFAILVSLPFSPTIVAQAPPVELEVVLNATDDKKPSETSVKQTRSDGFDKELSEIQKLSEQLNSSLPKLDSIKPLNTKAIPVNQPPHDGALIDFPNIINPPDMLLVEVLDALKGRPIQGERLVQPDGTISLGFYGRLYVSGLTLDQIKIKLLIHLRQYLSDEALGLVEQAEGGEWKAVDPEKSAKLVVDLASNHSRFYYVQGAVEVPGRYPINGKETVIDAITIAKGLKDDADLTKFSLIRPSHGDEAPRKFTIDWKKISEEGDRKSNLQVFPGDRLIVQKKTTKEAVAAKPELEVRAKPAEPIKSQLKSATGLPLKIGGRVDDPSGKPISGAEIMFLYLADEPVVGFEPKRLPPVKTDTDGTFLIEILPGEFKYAFVQITRPGYASQHIPFNREDARYESFINNNAKIELTEGTTVKGKVYDPDGKPLAGAQVYYSPRMYFSDAHTKISGSDGEFSFENIAKEKPSQVFYAKKPGYGTATIKIARTNGIPSELKLQMTPVREFNATITDIQGKPIAGVVAELRLVNIINGEYELFTTSDAEGKIKFSDLPKGKDIRVLFSCTEFAQKDAFIKGDDLSEKKIQLLKGVTGSGLVRNSQTLQPIDRFQVTLEPQNDQNTLRRNRETGDYRNGTFRLGATTFSPESFQLVIEAEGFKPFRTGSYKLDECPVKIDVKLDPIPVAELPHYRGKIIQPDGKPAGRVKIGVITDKDFPRIQKGQISWTQLGRKIPLADENGDFDFHTPEPVRELLVLHDSGAIRQLVEPGMDLNKLKMQLQPFGRLVGSLKRDGKPDLQSRMFLIYQSIQPQFWQTYEQIVLKQDGTFSMDRMIPGNFKISFEPVNIDENSRTNTLEAFSIKPGETVRLDRDLKLADVPRRDLVGKLQFPDGKIPGDLSLSRMILLAPVGNPLRGTPDNYISNSEKRLKYRETSEGKTLYQSLEEFPLLKKEVSTEGVFRISGFPAGRFELNILPGNANIIYGSAKKIIETIPLKSGELNQPVDLGEIMVERQVQKPPVKAEKPKEAGAVNVKPVSTPTPTIKIGGVVVDESVKLNQVKSRK